MKEKLKKFKSFANALLPHELRYLFSVHRFQDHEKIDILRRLLNKAEDISEAVEFDVNVDKRKYSYIQKWVQNELDKIDVDKKFVWISKMQQEIILDKISSKNEAAILKSLNSFKNTSFFFTKHYEMLIDLRHYLLIRRHNTEYKKVDTYLSEFTFDYQRSLLINQQMNQATKEIMDPNNGSSVEKIKWEKWLYDTFTNEQLDGLNRYMAFVRLGYFHLKENKLDKLENNYKIVQKFFENGQYYSKRLLLNFYDNSLVLYDRKKDYKAAFYYGKLSIKGTGPDQLLYFNNLINIMIKQDKYKEALELINEKAFKISGFKDIYSVIGYVSNHIRCLLNTGHTTHALNKAKVFWADNKSAIMEYRWHRFLTAYIETLLAAKDYSKIIRLVNRYKLLSLERKRVQNDHAYNQSIEAFYNLALYSNGDILKHELQEKLNQLQLTDPNLIFNKTLH